MTIQELFKSLGFKAISESLLHTHNRHELTVHDLAGYKMAYDRLCNMEFNGEGGEVTFTVTPREEWDDFHSLPLLADNVEGDIWENIVGKTVIRPTDNPFTDAELAGAILWGATFYGFTPKQREELFEEEFSPTVPTPIAMQIKRLNLKKDLMYCRNRKIRDELKKEMKSTSPDYTFSSEAMIWQFNQPSKRKLNRSKRKREYRIDKRIEELWRLHKIQLLLDLLRNDIGVVPDGISNLIKSATSIKITSYESCPYANLGRVDYLADLLLNTDYRVVDESSFEESAECICVILTSTQHQCSDEEQKQLKYILAKYFGKTKWQLLTGHDNSLEFQLRIKIIGLKTIQKYPIP